MIINAYFDNVLIFDVQRALQVVQGVKFGLEMENPEDGTEVFANNDKVLKIDHSGTSIEVEALELGMSTIRIMNGVGITKDLFINVVNEIVRPAVSLGVTVSVEPK